MKDCRDDLVRERVSLFLVDGYVCSFRTFREIIPSCLTIIVRAE